VGDELILTVLKHLETDPDFVLLKKEHAEIQPWFSDKLKSLGIKSAYRYREECVYTDAVFLYMYVLGGAQGYIHIDVCFVGCVCVCLCI
jgi:hypothetical protein